MRGVLSTMAGRKHYEPNFKAKVVLEVLKEEKTLSQIASDYGIHHSLLVRWRDQAIAGLPETLSEQNRAIDKVKKEYEAKIEALYSEVGKLSADLSWLKKKSGRLLP